MPKPGETKPQTVERVMHEFKDGDLKTGGGTLVKSRKQAVAIALSESGQSKAKSPSANARTFAKKDRGTA